MKTKIKILSYVWITSFVLLVSACSQVTPLPPTANSSLREATATQPAKPTKTAIAQTSTITATVTPPTLPTSTPSPVTSVDCTTPAKEPTAGWKFIFVSQGKLWIKERDSDARVIAEKDGIVDAKLSRDGKQVIFKRQDALGNQEIWSVNTNGSDLQILNDKTTLEGNVLFAPTGQDFSPDGRKYVFGLKPQSGAVDRELWVVNLDGSGVKRLVGIEELRSNFELVEESEAHILPMTWIPGTNRLIFFPYDSYEYVYIFDPLLWVDVDSGEIGEFLPEGRGGNVSFSPDGKYYVLVDNSMVSLEKTESHEIVKRIDYPLFLMSEHWFPTPGWAQDSSMFLVALPSDDAESYYDAYSYVDYTVPAPVTVWSMKVDDANPVKISTIIADIGNIGYSPDIELIAYSDWKSIGLLNQSGSMINNITPPENLGAAFRQWSPDSRHFTYLAYDDGCACGIDFISSACSIEPIQIQNGAYFSGYVQGFIKWLDSNHYLYYDYPSEQNSFEVVNLVLKSLDGEGSSWPIMNADHTDVSVIDVWVP